MKTLQAGFQPSAEGKLAPSAAPSPTNGLCSAALLWPPEQGRALGMKCCCPEGKNEASVCPKRGEKCLTPCRGWLCPPPWPVCTFGELRAELSRAERASGSSGQLCREAQAQIFLCPKSLTRELLYPTMTFSGSQTELALL